MEAMELADTAQHGAEVARSFFSYYYRHLRQRCRRERSAISHHAFGNHKIKNDERVSYSSKHRQINQSLSSVWHQCVQIDDTYYMVKTTWGRISNVRQSNTRLFDSVASMKNLSPKLN